MQHGEASLGNTLPHTVSCVYEWVGDKEEGAGDLESEGVSVIWVDVIKVSCVHMCEYPG